MMMSRLSFFMLALAAVVAACGSVGPRSTDEGGVPSPGSERRAIRQVMRVESVSLASKALQSTGISVRQTVRLLNAELDYADSRERPLPYLAEAT